MMPGKRTHFINAGFVMLAMAMLTVSLSITPGVLSDDSDYVIINVNITATTDITVLPTIISWGSVVPGSIGSVYNLSVQNTGSRNVTDMYASADTLTSESLDPLTIGNASGYGATRFLYVRNSTVPGTRYYPAGMVLWNLSGYLSGEDLNLSSTTTAFAHGWYKLANGNSFMWKVENGSIDGAGSDAYCNATNAIVQMQQEPENTTLQNRDFSKTTISTAVGLGNNTEYASFLFTDGPLNGTCVITDAACTKIFIHKYDKSSIYPACTSSSFLYSESNLKPGEIFDVIRILVNIPPGSMAGDTNTSRLTLTVTGQ